MKNELEERARAVDHEKQVILSQCNEASLKATQSVVELNTTIEALQREKQQLTEQLRMTEETLELERQQAKTQLANLQHELGERKKEYTLLETEFAKEGTELIETKEHLGQLQHELERIAGVLGPLTESTLEGWANLVRHAKSSTGNTAHDDPLQILQSFAPSSLTLSSSSPVMF